MLWNVETKVWIAQKIDFLQKKNQTNLRIWLRIGSVLIRAILGLFQEELFPIFSNHYAKY